MLGQIIAALINTTRAVRNAWQALLRRRVDYVRIPLRGALPELPPHAPRWQRLLRRTPAQPSLTALRRQLAQVADDPQATGVLLEIGALATGWATLQSLRDELWGFRSRGKRVVAYITTLDAPGYYLACAADEILMPPSAVFQATGFASEVQYLGDALARVGIVAEVEAVSPYKAAYERFTRADMSPENRAQLERLIDQRYQALIAAVAEGRGTTADAARELIDRAPMGSADAQAAGLIDGRLYEDELARHLGAGQEAKLLPWARAKGALRLPTARYRKGVVAVIPVEGTIVAGASQRLPLPLPLLGQVQAGSDSIAQAVRAAERNRQIAAAVLYVNSPGGDAFASDLIWREVLRLKAKKPVVVVMGDMAASGGYYVAAPASAIFAQPGTVTGSIGVIAMRPVVSGLLEKASIHTASIRRGANSGMYSITQPLSEGERAAWHRLIETIYADFRQRVVAGRSIAEAELEKIAGGRVWSGIDALRLGLVDALGGLPEGIRKAQELAGLPPDERAPFAVLRGGAGHLPPQPFPAEGLAALLACAEDGLRPRLWAILPFVGL